MVEEVENLRGLCLEKRHLTRPFQQVSAGSRVEVTARQETGPVCLGEEAQWDEVDQTGKAERLQQAPVVQVLQGWGNQAAADHPVLVGMVDADPQVPDQDLDRVVAGLLEEDEEQRLGLVEDPISEGPQAQASEPDQSTGPRLSQEEPTSKPGTESETPEEASEPDQPDRRNQETLPPVSGLLDLASEIRWSQDHAHPTDRVPASTVTENPFVMVQVEFYSPAESYPHARTPGMLEGAAKV